MISRTGLDNFLGNSKHPDIVVLQNRLDELAEHNLAEIIAIYKAALPLLEQTVWGNDANADQLDAYQQIFRELEAHINAEDNDTRHHIVLFIPVADRPRQLKDCLNSILTLCRLFNYGGIKNNQYQKITLVIGDDSKDEKNIGQHKLIIEQFNEQGIEILYFGQQEQLQQLDKLTEREKQQLEGILGQIDPRHFYHKGSPRMRNIANLKLSELQQHYGKVLFYSLDSDQEFQVKVSSNDGDRDCCAINYFYYLDEIFSQTDACILTGKVVGDPPVSPAVMMVNFLQDVISFIRQMAALELRQDCGFHFKEKQKSDAAAYHDMAEMFGFKQAKHGYHYPCPIMGRHDNGECFRRFAEKLNSFFYGEHPTRKTYYTYSHALASLAPARTVYPGNYVFNAQGLKYFIPFAPLKLRMNGPVMGRVIMTTLKEHFVSANLPMLHKRTVADTGQSEFRPDIIQQSEKIDLSGEFERQYFGDVMLFSMEKLTEKNFPKKALSRDAIALIVKATEETLEQQYREKHQDLMGKLELLKKLLDDSESWWNEVPGFDEAKAQFSAFIGNIEHNFSDDSYGYQLINSEADKQSRINQIIDAIFHYPDDKDAWEQVLSVR